VPYIHIQIKLNLLMIWTFGGRGISFPCRNFSPGSSIPQHSHRTDSAILTPDPPAHNIVTVPTVPLEPRILQPTTYSPYRLCHSNPGSTSAQPSHRTDCAIRTPDPPAHNIVTVPTVPFEPRILQPTTQSPYRLCHRDSFSLTFRTYLLTLHVVVCLTTSP
jgi:hypothetical protein